MHEPMHESTPQPKPKPAKARRSQVNYSLDPASQALLRQLAGGGRGVSKFLMELIYQEAFRRYWQIYGPLPGPKPSKRSSHQAGPEVEAE